MAIIKKITQPGNNVLSTLDGQIQIDEARGRMVVRDSVTTNEVSVVDVEGFKTFDPYSEKEITRNGRMPDGTHNMVIAPPGGDIKDAFI